MYRDPEAHLLTESFQEALLKGYRERKADAKEYFMRVGGYQDIPRAIANPPDAIDVDNWKKTIEYVQMDEHKIASARNKKKLKRVETFRKAHTDRDGLFVTVEAEQQYVMEELLEQTQGPEGERELTPAQERAAFEKVLGERHGHIRGIGRKPSAILPISQPSQPPPQPS
ncbi:unnamed protein product [Lactuca virosa]|uniref:Uncharacterized protein n=1 Tax=Lactuca virosa TaxID=75947 RepID=A0AAU9NDI0_9ASTR|nr:unnamed protein product [Lactuca virosa]